MATFNGASHLSRQIESIRNQSFTNWTLSIRDDGSSDGTIDIVKRFVNIDSRIKLVVDTNVGGSPEKNFGLLMRHALSKSDFDLVAFSDQDDFWLADKLLTYIDKYNEHLSKFSKDAPCLLFSDLAVVNNDLSVLDYSFWNMEISDPEIDLSLTSILNRNIMPGCSMIINKALLDLATPLPEEAIMHDWWILLLARTFGQIILIDKITMYYVQHGGNQLGAKKRSFATSLAKILFSPVKIYSKIKILHRRILHQSEALMRKDIESNDLIIIQRFIRIRNGNLITRIINYDAFTSSSFMIRTANLLIGF